MVFCCAMNKQGAAVSRPPWYSMAVINQKRSLLSRVGRWTAELVLVFVGVYGAFWLNNYQQHRAGCRTARPILASFEEQLRGGIDSGKTNRAKGKESRGVSARARRR